jgi:hypothetical protein
MRSTIRRSSGRGRPLNAKNCFDAHQDPTPALEVLLT